jgi:hypothetical protein
MDIKPKNDYMKKYYENNKDKFKEWSKTKINCECCNKLITAPNYATHCKSKKHLIQMEKLEKQKNNDILLSKDNVMKLLNIVLNSEKTKDDNQSFNLIMDKIHKIMS